jgi:hypothetical protein
MESLGSLLCSQETPTGPYREPDQSSPYHLILSITQIHPNIIQHLCLDLPSALSPSGFPTNVPLAFISPFRARGPVHLIFLCLIILIILEQSKS